MLIDLGLIWAQSPTLAQDKCLLQPEAPQLLWTALDCAACSNTLLLLVIFPLCASSPYLQHEGKEPVVCFIRQLLRMKWFINIECLEGWCHIPWWVRKKKSQSCICIFEILGVHRVLNILKDQCYRGEKNGAFGQKSQHGIPQSLLLCMLESELTFENLCRVSSSPSCRSNCPVGKKRVPIKIKEFTPHLHKNYHYLTNSIVARRYGGHQGNNAF